MEPGQHYPLRVARTGVTELRAALASTNEARHHECPSTGVGAGGRRDRSLDGLAERFIGCDLLGRGPIVAPAALRSVDCQHSRLGNASSLVSVPPWCWFSPPKPWRDCVPRA